MVDDVMTAEDKRWQAETDARTLARTVRIQRDPSRLKAAQVAAAKMAEKERNEAQTMEAVARKKTKHKESNSETVDEKPTLSRKIREFGYDPDGSDGTFGVFKRLD